MSRRFLTAKWRYLLMLNYEVEPAILRERVPRGTELDLFDGRTLVSLVGFLFQDTRVLGWAVPGHVTFEEVNLRFYVRHQGPEGWRRGVVFVKEIVPRPAIAWVARTLYQEPYLAMPMRHELLPKMMERPGRLKYEWRPRNEWFAMEAGFRGQPELPSPGSEEEFITEHYWGYNARRDGTTTEYQVEHPPWRVWTAEFPVLNADLGILYGQEFVEALSRPPRSAFIAEGSEVVVYGGRTLA